MTEDLVKKSKNLLFKTLNCCESQIIPIQKLYELSDIKMVRSAVTGLAGGINNNGSTCGVIFGGALNIATMQVVNNEDWTVDQEVDLINKISNYVNSFEDKFGSSLCRDRTGLNFRSFRGKIGLMHPKTAKGCVRQTEWAMEYVLNTVKTDINTSEIISINHCHTPIFDKFKEKYPYIDFEYLEKLSSGLSGGIGLSGGGCAALSAAIMILGFRYRKEVSNNRKSNFLRITDSLFTKKTNKMIDSFIEEFGSLECSKLTSNSFDSIKEFNNFRSNNNCDLINQFLIEYLSDMSF